MGHQDDLSGSKTMDPIFRWTLDGSARYWLTSMAPKSIWSFEELSKNFEIALSNKEDSNKMHMQYLYANKE